VIDRPQRMGNPSCDCRSGKGCSVNLGAKGWGLAVPSER
jgi:hypothetical protein